jgi:hypothetical protein
VEVPAHDPATRSASVRLAAATRWHPNSDSTTELRRELRAASLEAHIRRVVDEAPPLSAEQVRRIRALLPPVDDAPLSGGAE